MKIRTMFLIVRMWNTLVFLSDGKAVNAELALIQQYENAFTRIKEVTGEEDVETIVQNFVKDEAENFALFNYVNELNSEMETLNDQVRTRCFNIVKVETDHVNF